MQMCMIPKKTPYHKYFHSFNAFLKWFQGWYIKARPFRQLKTFQEQICTLEGKERRTRLSNGIF